MDKEKKPFISIFMPCYNHEDYVGETIESILGQTWKDYEFIVVDNGSLDHSAVVIRKYEDRITKVIYNKKNDPFIYNKAADYCNGKYIAFMCSDDLWKPEKLEKQVNILKTGEYAGCFTWARYVGEGGREMLGLAAENHSREEWIRFFWTNMNCLSFPSAVIERNVWKKVNSKASCFGQLNDWAIWINILTDIGNIYVVEEELVKMRRHSFNASVITDSTQMRTINEAIYIRQKMLKNLSPDLLKAAFGTKFLYSDAQTQEELECEKLYILIKEAEKNVFLEQYAMEYFWELHQKETIRELLEGKYYDLRQHVGVLSGEGGIVYWYMQANGSQKESLEESGAEEEQLSKEVFELLKNYVEKVIFYIGYDDLNEDIVLGLMKMCVEILKSACQVYNILEKKHFPISLQEMQQKIIVWDGKLAERQNFNLKEEVLPTMSVFNEFLNGV